MDGWIETIFQLLSVYFKYTNTHALSGGSSTSEEYTA